MRKVTKSVYGSYIPKMDEIAHGLALEGLTNAEIAEKLQISPAALYKWRNKYPSFKEALQAGKDAYDSEMVEKALLEDALGKEYEEVTIERTKEGEMVETKRQKKWQRNFQAQRMWLMNRHPERWKDSQEVILTAGDLVTRLQEAEKRLQELREKNGKASATGHKRCIEVETQGIEEGGQSLLPVAAGVE